MKARKRKTVRRRGSITPHTDGRFLARVRLPADKSTGKRGGSSKVCDSRADAERWLSDELARLDRGETVDTAGGKVKLGAFLRDFYTNHRKATKGDRMISPRTAQDDIALLDLYVLRRAPGIAETPIEKLTVPTLRDHFAGLAAAGLARATVSRIHRTLRARLNWAVGEGLIRFNPMADSRIPVGGAKKKERRILTGAQAGALFAVLPQSTEGTYIATLLWTGCRPSEPLALMWEDCDLDARTLHIRRALVRMAPTAAQRGKGEAWSIEQTKTGTERVLPIPDALVGMLRRHKAMQAENRLAAGREYQNNGLVFASPFGKPLHEDLIAARFLKPALRDAALQLAGVVPLPLPQRSRSKAYTEARDARKAQEDAAIVATGFPASISLYALRHNYASRLAADGVPIKTIQELMGHADIATTLGYVHADADAGRKALEKLEGSILQNVRRLSIA